KDSASTGAVVTSFSGNNTTVTDQALKLRQSTTDALGRLTKVIEDPQNPSNPNGLNYVTTYSYDELGNLRAVNQGMQTRTFTYDSLCRLLSAGNPEQVGLTTYTYDAASNVKTRKDPNGVTTTYKTYDALNRLTDRTYSDGTPEVTYIYDSAT